MIEIVSFAPGPRVVRLAIAIGPQTSTVAEVVAQFGVLRFRSLVISSQKRLSRYSLTYVKREHAVPGMIISKL